MPTAFAPPFYDAANRSIIRDENLLPDDNPAEVDAAAVEITAVTYPETIRVAHHPENNCRNVPDWQVDVIPFEEYVARSVPAEIPISWSAEALARPGRRHPHLCLVPDLAQTDATMT